MEINTIENGQEIRKMKTIEKEESDDDNAKDDDGKNIKGKEATKSNVDTVDIDSENEDVENAEICKKEEDVKNDPNLVYVEGGSDFEDNLNEKWKKFGIWNSSGKVTTI